MESGLVRNGVSFAGFLHSFLSCIRCNPTVFFSCYVFIMVLANVGVYDCSTGHVCFVCTRLFFKLVMYIPAMNYLPTKHMTVGVGIRNYPTL